MVEQIKLGKTIIRGENDFLTNIDDYGFEQTGMPSLVDKLECALKEWGASSYMVFDEDREQIARFPQVSINRYPIHFTVHVGETYLIVRLLSSMRLETIKSIYLAKSHPHALAVYRVMEWEDKITEVRKKLAHLIQDMQGSLQNLTIESDPKRFDSEEVNKNVKRLF